MIHRIVLTVTMVHIGLMPWVALSILGGETEMPTWLAWDLLALFGLVLLRAFGGFLSRKTDEEPEERAVAFMAMLGTLSVSTPAMIDHTTLGDMALVAFGAALLLVSVFWAVLVKPAKQGS